MPATLILIYLFFLVNKSNSNSCKLFTKNSVIFFCNNYNRESNFSIHVPTNHYYDYFIINHFYLPKLPDNIFLNKSIKILDLSSNKIESFSETSFLGLGEVNFLDVSSNNLTSLKQLSFSLDINNCSNLNYLRVDHNQLEFLNFSFPKSFKSLQNLSIKNNRIKFFTNEIFSSLTSLNDLSIDNNNLDKINKNLFKRMTKLRKLTISKNELESIEPSSFNNLNSLEHLDLSYNKLTILNQNLFDCMSNLKILILKNNKIISLSSSIFKMNKNIELIDLSYNQIRALSSLLFNNLDFLEHVYLSSNKISYLEEKIFVNCGYLSNIKLNDNEIKIIDENFQINSPNLNLNLELNNVSQLNENIFNGFKNQVFISLNADHIQTIKRFSFISFRNVSKYSRYLFLSTMGIENIEPYAFTGLDNLTVLYLNENNLQTLSKHSFKGLKNLQELILNANKICDIFERAFDDLDNLLELNLNKNYLETIPMEVLKLHNLKELKLDNNFIKIIKTKSFIGMKNLYFLSLSSNEIYLIEKNAFKSLNNLSYLSLNENLIEKIEDYYFEHLNSLRNLFIIKNKISFIDKCVFNSTNNLEELNLSLNSIFSLDFFLPLSVKKLILASNELNTIKKEFFQNSINLIELNLSNNKITKIEDLSFSNLTNLKKLLFQNNKLKSFLNLTGKTIIKATILNLNSNLIDNLSFLNFINVNKLFIENNNLSSIESESFKSLKIIEIDISNNPIKYFDSYAFIKYQQKYLKKIYLSNLSYLNEIKLDLNRNLEVLNISNSVHSSINISDKIEIEKIYFLNVSFKKVETLSSIVLNCKICHFSNFKRNISFIIKVLSQNKKLESIDFSNNMLGDLDFFLNFKKLDKMLRLIVANNSLKSVSFLHFYQMENLIFLDLSYNKLEYLDKHAFSNNKLEFLYLQHNLIKSLQFGNFFENFQQLALNDNRLENSNFLAFFNFKSDKKTFSHKIDLSNNYLRYFEIQLLSIKFIQIEYKKIFCCFKRLFSSNLIIILKNNKLEKINNQMFESNYIEEIDVSHNLIRSIDSRAFYRTTNILVLLLNNNYITELDSNLFQLNTNLKILDLSFNIIELLPNSIFTNLSNLKTLNLTGNKLKEINHITFSNLILLSKLSLTSNKDLSLKSNVFKNLKNLKYIYMDLNHLILYHKEIVHSLQIRYDKTVFQTNYTRSIRVIYTQKNLINCSIILYFIKNKILCNLETSQDFDFFINNCKNTQL